MSVWSHLRDIFGPEVAEPKPITLPPNRQGVRLARIRRAPSREDFAQWRENPVTRFVFAAYRAQAELCEQTWHQHSWEAGNLDPTALVELRTRADVYKALEDSDYEAFCDAAGVDPEPIEQPEIDRERM